MIPVLFESQYFSIQTLWVFVAVALLVGSYLAVQRLKHARVSFTLFIENSTLFFISALFLSRLLFFILHSDAYVPRFDLRTLINFFSIWDQGFSFWGALLGFLIALLYRLKKSEENTWKWMDALVVPVMLGLCIGGLGTFLSGYSYGRPTDLPWGVRYEVFNVKYTVPVHPVQLYGVVLILTILLLKRKLSQKTNFFELEGNATLYYVSTLSLAFFFLEFFRGDDTLLILGIRLPFFLFFLIFLISSFALWKRIQSFHKTPHES